MQTSKPEMSPVDQAAGAPTAAETPLDRKAVGAVILGNALEFYDFIAYSFFAKQIGDAYFPSNVPSASLLSSLLVFWIGFFTRPIGAVVIGAFGDRAGRKPAMLLTIALMAAGMLILAATPGFKTIGWWAPVIVVIGRLIQGFALGGEVGPSTAYLLEAAPTARRGYFASWQLASQGLAQLFAGVIGVGLTLSLSEAAIRDWGWRVPFFVGVAIIPVGLIIRNHLPETAGVDKDPAATASMREVFAQLFTQHLRLMILGVLVIMSGTVATYVLINMPTYATETMGLSQKVATGVALVLGIAGVVFSLAGGWLADRFGRRRVMIIPRAMIVLVTVPAFVWMIHQGSATSIYVVTILIAILTAITSAGSIVAIPEALPRNVRSAGLSIVYAISVTLFGGSTQWVVNKLIVTTGDKLAPAYYLAVLSAVGAVAAMLMPETKGKRLE